MAFQKDTDPNIASYKAYAALYKVSRSGKHEQRKEAKHFLIKQLLLFYHFQNSCSWLHRALAGVITANKKLKEKEKVWTEPLSIWEKRRNVTLPGLEKDTRVYLYPPQIPAGALQSSSSHLNAAVRDHCVARPLWNRSSSSLTPARVHSWHWYILHNIKKVDSSFCSYMCIANRRIETELGYIRSNIKNTIARKESKSSFSWFSFSSWS